MTGDLAVTATAQISPCGQYRYYLARRWGNGPAACFLMLNPSVADDSIDDPTIKKCVGFAQRWKMDAIAVVNLFAFRATKPADMKKAADPVGPENDEWILATCKPAMRDGGLIIAAWGANGEFQNRDEKVVDLLEMYDIKLKALRVSPKTGQPEHPLYVPYETPLQDYRGRVIALAGA